MHVYACETLTIFRRLCVGATGRVLSCSLCGIALVREGNKRHKRDTPDAVLAITSESEGTERGHREDLIL